MENTKLAQAVKGNLLHEGLPFEDVRATDEVIVITRLGDFDDLGAYTAALDPTPLWSFKADGKPNAHLAYNEETNLTTITLDR